VVFFCWIQALRFWSLCGARKSDLYWASKVLRGFMGARWEGYVEGAGGSGGVGFSIFLLVKIFYFFNVLGMRICF
jgi:hypothetical protein